MYINRNKQKGDEQGTEQKIEIIYRTLKKTGISPVSFFKFQDNDADARCLIKGVYKLVHDRNQTQAETHYNLFC